MTFSRVRMGDTIRRAGDGSVDFSLFLGKDFKYEFFAHLPAGDRALHALDIHKNEIIGPVSAYLSLAQPRHSSQWMNETLGPELVDLTFDFPRVTSAVSKDQ